MVEDHGNFEPRDRTIGWNQNFLPNQRGGKIVHLERDMSNRLYDFGIRRIWVKSHPLNATRTGSKSRYADEQVGYVNLVGTRGLSGNSNVVVAPAILRDCSRGLVILPQISGQTGTSINGSILEPPDVIGSVNPRKIRVTRIDRSQANASMRNGSKVGGT